MNSFLPSQGASRLVGLAVALACIVAAPRRAGAQTSSGGAAGTKATPVDVVKPERKTMIRDLNVPATLIPDELADLYAKTSGYVAQVNVDIGSQVKSGDVLVTIDVPEMADELRQAEAILKAREARVQALEAKAVQARRMIDVAKAEIVQHEAQKQLDGVNLKRKEDLHKGNAIPAQMLDEARNAAAISTAQWNIAQARVAGSQAELQAGLADVQVAKAEAMVGEADVSRIKTMMRYATIRAPFDGVITMRNVDRGAFVRSAAEGAATQLLRIAKTNKLRVVFEIPEDDTSFVRVGTVAEITVGAISDKPMAGKISRTASVLEADTRSMRAEIDLPNDDGTLIAGMYASVVVRLDTKSQAMMIPSKALRADGDDTVVLVCADGVARSVPVQVGYDDGIEAEILSGLTGDEAVITASGGAVVPGASVQPVFSDS